MKPEVLAKASQKGASGDNIEEGVTHFERRLRREEKEYLLLVRMLIERPERIGRVREHLDAGSIQSEPLRELFEAVFRCEGEGIEESALLGEIRSEEAQQMLSKLMFDEIGPELLYPVEWWIGFRKSRRKEKTLKELSMEIAQAEKSGDVGGLEGFLRRKAEANRELVEIKRGMMKVSVDSSVGSTIGG